MPRWDRRSVTLYTRRQLVVLLLLLAAAGCGLAIGHWRRQNPDLVERVEQLDRAPAPAASVTAPQPVGRPRAVRSSAEAEPRRTRRSRTPRETAVAPLATADASQTPEIIGLDRLTDGSSPCP
jgi:hypothetical protein